MFNLKIFSNKKSIYPSSHTHTHTHTHKHVVPSISFQTFLYRHLKVSNSWKFIMLLLYILWDDWPIFMISGSNKQLQQQSECTLLKPDCHSRWISIMQSGREDNLEERYAIKLCFKLRKTCRHKNVWNASDCFSTILHESSISCIRDSRKTGSLWGMMRGVGGVRKPIHQSWLAKGLGLWLLCWGSKGV